MKGKLYKSVKSREEIESSQLFSTMLQKVGNTGAVVIDGKNLMADSIYARHIQSKQITTDHLVVGVATADLINTGGLEITNELKVVHGGKDVLFINTDGALEMNISALKIGLVDFDKDINTKIEAIAGSWSQLNLNKAGDIISGINANDKGTNIHGKNISLTGDTDVQGDFRVSGNQVILNADTDIRGDFKVSGGSVVLDANTDIRGDFTVSGNKVVLDAETTVLDTFTVKGDMLASNLDVEQLTIRAKNGLQNVLHIDSTGRVELNVDRFHIRAIDVESELANRATKEELENIELTPGPPGPKGDKGDKGVDGRSISNVVIEYAASLSRTQVPPQSEFSPNTPIWSSGKYIWSQTRTTYEDNKPDSVSKPAVITGDEGQSVLDITQEYAVTTSKTIVPSSYQFNTTRAAWEIGRYVWTRSKITYENPTKVDYTTPVVSTEWEAVNVIDAKINNAVTTIDGSGVTVKDGNFFLEDNSSSEKYSLKIKTNLITDHGIEFVSPTTAATNISGGATFNMAKEVYSGSHNNVYSHMPTGNIDIWSIGSPYLYISYLPNDFVNADYTPIFGATSGVVNNQNYFEAKVDSRISKNTTYTFSAHFKKHPNMTGSYPKIEVFQRKKQSTLEYRLASETFSYTSSNEDVIRYSVTFTTNNEFSTGMYFLRLRVTSSNSNYVMVDGLQLVEGNHPVQYHSEDTASFYQRDNRTQISGLQFDVRQLQSNKPIHSQGTAGQGKWIRFEDGMAIVEHYIRTIPGNSWTQWGSMWYLYLEYHWDFPIYFQNPPAVTGSLSLYTGFLSPDRVSNQRASSIAVYRPVNTGVWSTGQLVYLSAIGRWKN